MKKHNIFIFGMILLICVTNIFAVTEVGYVQSLPPVKQYDCVKLPQICGACTYNNISSISYPNSSQAIGEVAMDKLGTEYNYTFCDTSTLGKYIVKGYGDPSGIIEPWAYDFTVTTTGTNNNNTIPLFLAIGGFIIFIVAILTRNLYIGFISGIIFIVLGIYLMIFGLGFISDFYTSALAYVALGFGLLIFLSAAYEAITDTRKTIWQKNGDDDDDF
jgi:hypothetical protein